MSAGSGPLVIVGAGLAAGTLVSELRQLGDVGEIVVFGAEPYPPYERPPLSKSYLRGESKQEEAYVQNQDWYDENGVRLITGSKVHQIHLDEHTVGSRAGNLRYSQLVLATGAGLGRIHSRRPLRSPFTTCEPSTTQIGCERRSTPTPDSW